MSRLQRTILRVLLATALVIIGIGVAFLAGAGAWLIFHNTAATTSSPAALERVVAPVAVDPTPVRVLRMPQASRSRPVAPKPSHEPRVVRQRPQKPAQRVVGGRLYDITWYCDRSIMADGGHTHLGVVAVASRSIPFGTRVYIDGVGTFVVEDHIGHGSDFDVWTPSCSEAVDGLHGRKHRSVRFL